MPQCVQDYRDINGLLAQGADGRGQYAQAGDDLEQEAQAQAHSNTLPGAVQGALADRHRLPHAGHIIHQQPHSGSFRTGVAARRPGLRVAPCTTPILLEGGPARLHMGVVPVLQPGYL